MNFMHLDRPWSRTDRNIVRLIFGIYAALGAMALVATLIGSSK